MFRRAEGGHARLNCSRSGRSPSGEEVGSKATFADGGHAYRARRVWRDLRQADGGLHRTEPHVDAPNRKAEWLYSHPAP